MATPPNGNQVWSLVKAMATTNYLLDPSFEAVASGALSTYWTVVQSAGATVAPAIDSTVVRYGLNSARINGAGNFVLAQQTVSGLTPGKTLRCSTYVFATSGTAFLKMQTEANTVGLTTHITSGYGAWQRVEMDYTVPASGSVIYAVGVLTGGLAYFDGCQMEYKDSGTTILNGSMDQWAVATTPDSWTASGGTISQSTNPVYAGYSSAKVTGAGATLSQTTSSLTNGQSMTISFYARVSGSATLTVTDNGTNNVGTSSTLALSDTGGAFNLFTLTKTVLAYTLGIAFSIGVSDSTSVLYVDSVTCVPTSGFYSNCATTYIDGDMAPDGGAWVGGALGRFSTASTRSDNNRRGGAIFNFDIFNAAVTGYEDFAYSPIRVVDATNSTTDGGQYQTSYVDPRKVKLSLFIDGSSAQDLAHKRDGIKEIIKLDATTVRQESTIIYHGFGSMPDKYIRGAWQSGLNGIVQKGDNGFFEETDLTFKCNDPYFYTIGNNATNLYGTQSFTANYMIGRTNNSWSTFGNTNGDGEVIRIRYDTQGNALFCGRFNHIGGITTTGIALLNIAAGTWSTWGAGLSTSGFLTDAWFAPNGDLYVVGSFTSINGVAASNCAKLPKATGVWTAMGAGLSSTAWTLAWDGGDGLYIGSGQSSGGATGSALVAWSLANSTWLVATAQPPSAGVIYSLTLVPGGQFAVGGQFLTFGGTTVNNGCLFNSVTSAVTALGTGFAKGGSASSAQVWATALSPRNTVIWGGKFDTANGVTTNNVAEYNWTTLLAMGSGVTGTQSGFVQSNLIVRGLNYVPDGSLYVSGYFDTVKDSGGNSIISFGVAKYFNGSWRTNEIAISAQVDCVAYSATNNGTLFYGMAAAPTVTGLAYITQVTITGTAPTYPSFTIIGPCILNSIVNVTSGATLYFNSYAVAAGEIVTVNLSVLGKSVISSLNGGTDITRILGNSDMANFRLMPGRTNYIYTYLSGTTTAATAVTMAYPAVWDSGDGGA